MPHPLIGTTVLANAENIIIVPLHAITMVYTTLMLCFVPWAYDPETNEERQICCTRFSELPSYLDPSYLDQPRVPLLFEIVGQIYEEDCFLTSDGYESPESSGQNDECLATCWIETRHDYISRIYWLGIVPAIQEITNHIAGEVNTSQLLMDEGGVVRLQVCYQPPAGQSITSTLPLYNIYGGREVPSCLAEVPFGEPMRVAFAIQVCTHRGKTEGEPVLIAVLEHMVAL